MMEFLIKRCVAGLVAVVMTLFLLSLFQVSIATLPRAKPFQGYTVDGVTFKVTLPLHSVSLKGTDGVVVKFNNAVPFKFKLSSATSQSKPFWLLATLERTRQSVWLRLTPYQTATGTRWVITSQRNT